MSDLIEAATERAVVVRVPIPSSLEIEDAEGMQVYIDDMIVARFAEWFDEGLT